MNNLELSLEFSDVDIITTYKYKKSVVSGFENILHMGNKRDIFLYIIKQNIFLTEFGGEFSTLAPIVANINIDNIDEFFEINSIKSRLDFIENDLLKNIDFYVSYIASVVKNKTRQKGSFHFANKIKKNFSKYINVEIVKDLTDFKLKNNTIYVSSSDKILTGILKLNSVKDVPKKGIDIIVNINNRLSFGEAKEINGLGGTQSLQYKNIEEISNLENGFGIIYGSILFSDNPIKRSVENNPNIYTIWDFKNLIS